MAPVYFLVVDLWFCSHTQGNHKSSPGKFHLWVDGLFRIYNSLLDKVVSDITILG